MDPDVAPDYTLLHALLDCLPMIPCAYSSGALQWYFTLLNRVKCMDISMTASQCAEMLAQVARAYNERGQPQHSLLKARSAT